MKRFTIALLCALIPAAHAFAVDAVLLDGDAPVHRDRKGPSGPTVWQMDATLAIGGTKPPCAQS